MSKRIMQFGAQVETYSGGAVDEASPWVNPADLSGADRLGLIKRIEAREVYSVRFKARAFSSGETNSNRAFLSAAQVSQLAATAAGTDLVTDHAYSVAGTIGEVTEGETREEDGERVLVLSNEVTDVASMVAFVQRRLRRFSIALEADDWLTGADGKSWAQGDVRLVHNAFVSDPAYRGAEVIKPFGRQQMAEDIIADAPVVDDAPQEASKVDELEAALAALTSKYEEIKVALEEVQTALGARESSAFDEEFSRACAQGKVKPSSKPQFEAIRKSAGFDAVVGLFAAFEVGAVLPVRAVGAGGGKADLSAPVAGGKLSVAAMTDLIKPVARTKREG